MMSPKPTRPFRTLDSAVLLERLDSTASSEVYLRQGIPRQSDRDAYNKAERGSEEPPPASITLDLSIRFGRLGLLTLSAVTVIAALMLLFKYGVVLASFDPSTTTADDQKQLLDDYNSYTGNIASLFGKPIEILVALAVQVLVLRVLAASMLRSELSWQLDALTLLLSAGVGYLINNGFNALNVQLDPPQIEPAISAVDLSFVPDFSIADAAARSSNLTRTIPEYTQPDVRNPITNTILRNLVLPRVPIGRPYCDWQISQDAMSFQTLPDLVLEYGFTQREWHGRLLQESIPPKWYRLVVNATNTSTTTNQRVSNSDLPMKASTAADLFVYSMFVAPFFFPWTKDTDFVDELEVTKRYPTPRAAGRMAHVTGLLPPETTESDETAQREWFLRESAAALTRKLKGADNTTRSNVAMDFWHVDISGTIRFEALTIEIEVDAKAVADATDKKDKTTRYNKVIPYHQCGPWPATCMMRKPPYLSRIGRESGTARETAYDPPAQVQAFGSCVDSSGKEQLGLVGNWQPGILNYALDCDRISDKSLMVISIGKRFVADSLTQNKTANASGYFDSSSGEAVLKNLRRIYTYTIGKLSWEPLDFKSEYRAKTCAQDVGSCNGLRLPLAETANNNNTAQEVIVGVDALPLDLITPPSFNITPRFLKLVRLHEPSSTVTGNQNIYEALAGDPLLSHNMGPITWDRKQPPPIAMNCISQIEERLQLVLNNHYYIEHGLQTAYTAATFFLLQNSVVKSVIELEDGHKTLDFKQNVLQIGLRASIPAQNAWLSIAGCSVLVVGLCAVMAWAQATSRSSHTGNSIGSLGLVRTPQAVAKVLLDSVHFPPMLLDRRVVVTASDGVGDGIHPTADAFTIDALSLQHRQTMDEGL